MNQVMRIDPEAQPEIPANKAAPDEESENSGTIRLCGICRYTVPHCLGHDGLRHHLRGRARYIEVTRGGEAHKLALSSFYQQQAMWDRRERESGKHSEGKRGGRKN